MFWEVEVAEAAGVSVVLVSIALELLLRFIIIVRFVMVWFILVNLWVVSMTDVLYNCVESVVVISGVRYNTSCAVSFLQRVFAFNNVSITNFPLMLFVTGVFVVDSIFVLVLGICIVVLIVVWCIS